MPKNATYRLVLSGFLVGLGLLLPFATAHAFGMAGTFFLPMHLPVFLIGLLCGPALGAAGGILIPVLSSLLTGMPAFFPMLPIMAGELCTYGLMSGLLYQKVRLPLYPSILISMVSGRVVYGLIFQALLLANSGSLKALSVTGALAAGIPGIIVQLTVLPAIVFAVEKHSRKDRREPAMLAEEKAKRLIQSEKVSCAVIRDGKIVHTANGRGISPLIALYESDPEQMRGALIVDKIIGKAAAMMIVLGGAKSAYGETMSASARDYLAAHGCEAGWGKLIEIVSNRAGDGMCPLENSVLSTDDPETGYHILKETINRMRSAG